MARKKDIFHFKQFSVQHDRSSMKVGTDAVLIGAWTSLHKPKRILEVGTGSGVISLMLAQRTDHDTHIDAIDISPDDCEQARENVLRSPWPQKITVQHQALQQFQPPGEYDLIISNPPYFNKSQLPPSSKRSAARHTHALSYPDLLTHSKRLLQPDGRLAVILPSEEGNQFTALASEAGLNCIRRLAFYSRREKPQERWLLEFSYGQKEIREDEPLCLHAEGETWSPEYIELTKDFYLHI